jgi:pheromone shutdown protein TraB
MDRVDKRRQEVKERQQRDAVAVEDDEDRLAKLDGNED